MITSVCGSSITVFVPWQEMEKKGLFSMTLLSKISAKSWNNLCSSRELYPSLQREMPATKPVDHQVFSVKNKVEFNNKLELNSKSWKPCAQYKNLGHFTSNFQFPFFFKISQCTNTANILLCNKMHLKWTHKVFFHVPCQKNLVISKEGCTSWMDKIC